MSTYDGSDRPRIRWAPKVSRSKLRRVYDNDASGVIDDDLLDDVGWSLWHRCESILMVTSADRLVCPACGALVRSTRERWPKRERITCVCGWWATYGEWRDSWRSRSLHGGNAVYAFEEFFANYPKARTSRERMLAIDRVINAFHWSLRMDVASGPVGPNLLEGRLDEVRAFLDELSGGLSGRDAALGASREGRRRGARSHTGGRVLGQIRKLNDHFHGHLGDDHAAEDKRG